MSLRKTLLLVGLVLALLLPAALTLKNQNPWNCFAYTIDENYFLQSSWNWLEGRGYRVDFTGPFDPSNNVGIPMAWGASAVHAVTGGDFAVSGRFFVYLCFILLLLVVGKSAYKKKRDWLAVPFAIGLFAYGLTKIPYGGYFAFGFLGEGPGLLVAAFAYRALDEKKFFRAGLLSVATFAVKPTFVFLAPAMMGATLFQSRRASIRLALGTGIALFALFYGISVVRGESLFQYAGVYFNESNKIAHLAVYTNDLFGFYRNLDLVPMLYLLAFFVSGGLAVARRRAENSAEISAFLVILFAIISHLFMHVIPPEKHWDALFLLTLLGFCVPWGNRLGNFFNRFVAREEVPLVLIAAVATWAVSMGELAYHQYIRYPETACNTKEQGALNQKMRELAKSGEANAKNTVEIVESGNLSMMLYSLDWLVPYFLDWKSAERSFTPVVWATGSTKLLFPPPPGCLEYWRGESFSIVHCPLAIGHSR